MAAADQHGVRYSRSLGPSDVGTRVVLRRRLADGALGDLLGELRQWDETTVVVQDRHGEDHVVRRADVLAGKRVPPPPPRRGEPLG